MPFNNQAKKYYLICYDIIDTRKRTKLAKLLKDYGIRVQKSVFEALLHKEDLERMTKQVEKYVSMDDSVRIYELSQTSYQKKIVIGLRHHYDPLDDVII